MADKNYTNKIGMDTSEAQRGLKEINASLKDLKASVQYATVASQDFNSKLVLLNKIVDENVEKEKLLENEYNKLANATDKNFLAITKAHEALEKQRTATELARQDVEKFTEANIAAKKAADEHTIKINTLSYVLTDLASTLAKKACKALVDFTKETINTGMQFESAFAGVKKVTSGTEEELKKLENQIRQTALIKPISAEQLASVYQMGSQLGIAKEGLKDFSDAIIDLAKTSDLTEEAGASLIAQYANVTKLPVEDYRKFASTLSYLGSNTATTESVIMDFASRISGSAKLIGMTNQEILALSTAMGSVGIKAEMGGSAISKIMNSIDVSVDKNNETLRTWAEVAGMTASEFAYKWKTDVTGAFTSVISGMAKFKDEGGSLNILLEELDIKNIRQTETLKKLANASEMLAEDIRIANKEWEDATFLATSTEAVYDTLESKTQVLNNSIKELQITLFQKVLSEPLTNLATTAAKVTQGIIANIDKIIIIAKSLISVLAGVIAKFLVLKAIQFKDAIVGGFNAIKTSVVGLITSLKAAIVAQEGLNLAMKANIIGVVTTGIFLLITAIQSFCGTAKNATDITKENTEALEKQRDELIANSEERKKTEESIDSVANETQEYVDKLKNLVDENGRVIGSKEELNEAIAMIQTATGEEIKVVDGQIVKYKELLDTLDKVIAKKRLEAKINAYQGDYENAIKEIDGIEEQIKDKKDNIVRLENEINNRLEYQRSEMIAGRGANISYSYAQETRNLQNKLEELKNQKSVLLDSKSEFDKTIDKYEGLIKEQYTSFTSTERVADTKEELLKQKKELESTLKTYQTALQKGSSEIAYQDVEAAQRKLNEVENKLKALYDLAYGSSGYTGSSTSSYGKKVKEESKTTYQELLNQEKAYGDQLKNYLEEVKNGNSQVTVEMVQDTKKKLEETQKKVKEMKELLGDNTVTSKLVLNDETYGGLTQKRQELKDQLSQLQTELANGNQSITQDMLNNVGKQIDQVEAKMKNLKNEWDESGADGEISDEFESENTNHVSKGVIFGKGVLGDNAVEIEGAGKDAAGKYLDAFLKEKEDKKNQIAISAIEQANTEATNYQLATIDPNNLAIYDTTERMLAESKQTSQAQGLTDNAYKVIDAETWTLNQAIEAAKQIDYKQIGRFMCVGIANGISENAHLVVSAVRTMMAEANAAAKDEEKIKSPSKVFYRFGKYMDLGLANGIRDYASEVSTQVRQMTSRANDAISLANNQMKSERLGNQQTLSGSGPTEINYNFVQNNTSNKSLDTLAIYQESKSMLKRAVRNQYV